MQSERPTQMIERTKDRLQEARFFLGHLHDEREKHAHPNKPPLSHFRYYLHAFIGAARSVTWVLQSEEREKYDAWVGLWDAQKSKAEKALQELTNDMRLSAVKRGHVETIARSEQVQIPIDPNPYQIHSLRAYALQLRQGGGPWTTKEDHFVEFDGTEREITTVCEQYFQFLERLVNDFAAKHPE
jgi:hypothetical protein